MADQDLYLEFISFLENKDDLNTKIDNLYIIQL
mgnify:CR=1 FL=1